MHSLHILPPRPLSLILYFLDEGNRLNLRLVCKELEETISLTDLNVCGAPTLTIVSNCVGKFQFLTANRFRFSIEDNDSSRFELLRIRRRLFKKMITHTVNIRYINYNKIQVSYVESLLGDIEFHELWIDVEKYEFNPNLLDFVRKHANKEVKLIMYGFRLDGETLLSLPRLRQLSVVKVIIDQNQITGNDDLFLSLLRRRHIYMDIPVHPLTPQTLLEAIEIVASSPQEQFVTLHVPSDFIVLFIEFFGQRRIGDEFEEQSNADKDFEVELFEKDPYDVAMGACWPTESFTLHYR
ncbi:hypothetical protein PFISCL1PPCAC_14465, partial [Pristionchus fissidentatus]